MFDDSLTRLLKLALEAWETALGERRRRLDELITEIRRLQSIRRNPVLDRDEQYFLCFRLLLLAGEAGLYDKA